MQIGDRELLRELNKIGVALTAERDTDSLLALILEETMYITRSDGGSLYITEEQEGKTVLRFKIARNRSRDLQFDEFVFPLDRNSIAGYVALTKEILHIPDVREISPEIGVHYNDKPDKKINYRTVNMLVIPMIDYNRRVVGVLQLINKKREYDTRLGDVSTFPAAIVNYTDDEKEVVSSLASQAAMLLERSRLYEDIQALFLSFIEAMVTALDARDTTTYGHSRRLARLSYALAQVIGEHGEGPFQNVKFSKEELREIYYAALLHDIGKIGVRENVLLKRNRLSDDRMSAIRYRFSYLKATLEVRNLLHGATPEEVELLNGLDRYYEFVDGINKKLFITDEDLLKLKHIGDIRFLDMDGCQQPLLDAFELENLMIRRGNLTAGEREIMNSHVTHSHDLLKRIRWTKDLQRVPEIAGAHHEKMDGTGYPRGLKGSDLTVQARILAILDIFEALTASDRPYKPALPTEKALAIIEEDVKAGRLDGDIFEVFVKARVWETNLKDLAT